MGRGTRRKEDRSIEVCVAAMGSAEPGVLKGIAFMLGEETMNEKHGRRTNRKTNSGDDLPSYRRYRVQRMN